MPACSMQVDSALASALTAEVLEGVVASVPDAVADRQVLAGAPAARAAYRRYLMERLPPPRRFVEEARACPLNTRTTTRSCRVVPRVERGERINAGVILSCPDLDFLEARIELDAPAVLALDPAADLDVIRANLAIIPVVCRGGPRRARSASCPAARDSAGWCRPAAPSCRCPRSTPAARAIPPACLERLIETVVRRRTKDSSSELGVRNSE